MHDNLDQVWNKFWGIRNQDLFNKFNGFLKAVVVETNDPLNMHRIRFRCPELHDGDVSKDRLPWALPAFSFGGAGAGEWNAIYIGDIVYIGFEKGHPFSPVWFGAASPTRIRSYVQQSIYTKTPRALENGKWKQPTDYIEDYLPKDGRPMSNGYRDKYGNFHLVSSVGYFPKNHDIDPLPVGTDNLSQGNFEAKSERPAVNDPDVKMISQSTKYGITIVSSDVGYKWNEEFEGDFLADDEFETQRSKYLLKQFTENEFKDRDQRRFEIRTRYGHKVELRDVGWDKSREGEYGPQKTIGNSKDRDERLIKIRTKAGHFISLIDTGTDPVQDEKVKTLNKSEFGVNTEKENELGSDARMVRVQTRYGIQMVLDDRGSDTKDATNKETPRGAGWFVKGRRDGRGMFMGFNEKDEFNNMQLTTPRGKSVELNDRFGFAGMCTDLPTPISEERKDLYGVTWNTKSILTEDFEYASYHLKLDKKNKYSRLKNPTGAGMEFRDPNSSEGACSYFSEMRDADDRGIFMNTKDGYAVWRSKDNMIFILIDDDQSLLSINNEKDLIQIKSKKNVEIVAASEVVIKSNTKISLKAEQEITFEVGGTRLSVTPGTVGTNAPRFIAREVIARATSAVVAGSLGGTSPGPGFGIEASDPSQPNTAKPAKPDGKNGARLLGKPDNEDCTEEQQRLQKIADAQKPALDAALAEANAAFDNATSALASAKSDAAAARAAKGTAAYGEAKSKFNASASAYAEARASNIAANNKYRSLLSQYNKAQAMADNACNQTDHGISRACAPNRKDAGPVPIENAGGGGGTPYNGGSGTPTTPPDEPSEIPVSPEAPTTPSAEPPVPPEDTPDPITEVGGSGGCLWYGTTDKFIDDILSNGINLLSFANLVQIPPELDDKYMLLPLDSNTAVDYAIETQKRYGGDKLYLLRIRQVVDPDLLYENDDITAIYFGDVIESKSIEVVNILNHKPEMDPIYII